MKSYQLKNERFEHAAGTVVYDCMVHDYGLANDDTRFTGVQHKSVTLREDGGYPSFTVAVDDLLPTE